METKNPMSEEQLKELKNEMIEAWKQAHVMSVKYINELSLQNKFIEESVPMISKDIQTEYDLEAVDFNGWDCDWWSNKKYIEINGKKFSMYGSAFYGYINLSTYEGDE